MEWVEWEDTLHPQCEACTAIYRQRTPPEDPPCGTCRVEPLPENADVARVFLRVRNQVVTVGQGRVIDVSVPAIATVMELEQVRDPRDCLLRVLHLWRQTDGEKWRKGQT